MFVVLRAENLDPDSPCMTGCCTVTRWPWTSSPKVSGEVSGRTFRTDLDAQPTKAVEAVAFINGMETTWLLDSSIPLTRVFRGYVRSLGAGDARRRALRKRLAGNRTRCGIGSRTCRRLVVRPGAGRLGGSPFTWPPTAMSAPGDPRCAPARSPDLYAVPSRGRSWPAGSRGVLIAVRGRGEKVRAGVLGTLESARADLRLWGPAQPAELVGRYHLPSTSSASPPAHSSGVRSPPPDSHPTP